MEKTEEEKFYEAYRLTIAARNFHFDNFSKWMTYYYVAVAAIFVAYYSTKVDENIIRICLSFFGLIASILWHLSCKGYYFWIKNWTLQLKRFEDCLDDKYKTYTVFSEFVKEKEDNLWNPIQSANISTSKLTLILSFLICFGWSYLFTAKLSVLIFKYNLCAVALVSIILAYSLIVIIGQFLKTDLSHHKTLKP